MKITNPRKPSALILVASKDILLALDKSDGSLNVTQLSEASKRKRGIVATTLKYLFRHGWVATHHGKWRYKRAASDKIAFSITKSGRKQLGKLPD